MSPVSRHALKFLIRRFVSMLSTSESTVGAHSSCAGGGSARRMLIAVHDLLSRCRIANTALRELAALRVLEFRAARPPRR